MPRVRHIHYWPEGGKEVFEAEIESAHPDGTEVARAAVARMYRDVCEDMVEADDEAES